DACDTLSPLSATVCPVCTTPLGVVGRSPTGTEKAVTGESPRVCPSCGADVVSQHRFCGNCGARVASNQPGSQVRTMYFGSMQQPGRAKLIHIKGEGLDGVTYHLSGSEHIAGRLE